MTLDYVSSYFVAFVSSFRKSQMHRWAVSSCRILDNIIYCNRILCNQLWLHLYRATFSRFVRYMCCVNQSRYNGRDKIFSNQISEVKVHSAIHVAFLFVSHSSFCQSAPSILIHTQYSVLLLLLLAMLMVIKAACNNASRSLSGRQWCQPASAAGWLMTRVDIPTSSLTFFLWRHRRCRRKHQPIAPYINNEHWVTSLSGLVFHSSKSLSPKLKSEHKIQIHAEPSF